MNTTGWTPDLTDAITIWSNPPQNVMDWCLSWILPSFSVTPFLLLRVLLPTVFLISVSEHLPLALCWYILWLSANSKTRQNIAPFDRTLNESKRRHGFTNQNHLYKYVWSRIMAHYTDFSISAKTLFGEAIIKIHRGDELWRHETLWVGMGNARAREQGLSTWVRIPHYVFIAEWLGFVQVCDRLSGADVYGALFVH